MRKLGLLALGILCGALAVSGQDGSQGDELTREIDRLQKLLAERIEQRKPQEEKALELRFYDVADLCMGIQGRLQPVEELHGSKYQPPEAAEEPEPTERFEIDFLIEMIKGGIEPQSWDMEGADIQPKNDRLLVRTIPRVHGKIAKFLRWCRESGDRHVVVDVAVVPVADALVPLLTDALELTPEDAQRLASHPLGAVSLAGWDAQLIGGRVGREISYVEDYDVQIGEEAAIGEPIRNTLFAGCSAQVQACLDDQGGAMVECRIQLSRVTEPLPVHPTAHGTIDLPNADVTRVLSSFWAPLERTVVAGGCTVGEKPCVVLVTVRRR
jgi:hypothetical protein